MLLFVRRCLCLLLCTACVLATASAQAQTLADLRDQLSRDLSQTHFAKSFVGMVNASNEIELSSANYTFDNDADTELTVFALPFQTSVPTLGGKGGSQFFFEGVLGYAKAEEEVADLYQGAFPAAATSVDADWTTYTAIGGVGLTYQIGRKMYFTPIVNLGIARLESDADFAGPGAALTDALTQDIVFNWDAWLISYGVAGRFEITRSIQRDIDLEFIARYDLRWTETISTDNNAQDFATSSQILTLRADLTGPSNLELFDRSVDWRTTLGYRAMLDGDLYGSHHIVQIGGALEMSQNLPLGSKLSLSTAVFFGDDVVGWSVGLGVSF